MNIDSTSMLRVLLGEHARHVPAWLYVQHAGPGLVTFVGSSRVAEGPHPLRYGSELVHQLIVGELVVRPHYATETDALAGSGLSGLVLGHGHETALAGRLLVGKLPS